MAQNYQYSVARDHLEASLRMLEEEARISKHQYDEQAGLFRKERADL
jgi:hypothetical protein